ncbi:MAG: hypothetical protein FJW32_03545 [Acidobacteria bacterium]|nr:hypothetical protein [Acidobacteriota bacterium]
MKSRYLLAALMLPSLLQGQSANPTVRFNTVFGDIDVELFADIAPRTVTNFMNYVQKGAFNNTFIHRSVPGFVVQGGGFTFRGDKFEAIPEDPPVVNEFRTSNTRGTIAMAKLGSGPNTATNQWFFNLSSTNASNLDFQNGGFTVFGRIINPAGLAAIDQMARTPTFNLGSPFDQIPLINFRQGSNAVESNFVLIRTITTVELPPPPTVSAAGILTAANFGGYNEGTPGTYLEIYGTNLSGEAKDWSGLFVNNRAPTLLNDTTVTIANVPAFISYASPGQVNVQIPTSVITSGTVPIVVSYKGRPSAAVNFALKPSKGGLLAPLSFKVGDKQFVAAQHNDSKKFVSNGTIEGTENLPAVPGEILLFYGIGFGEVRPSAIGGQIASGTQLLAAPIEFKFGPASAKPAFAGLIPGLVGLYQFNVVVPDDAPAGDIPLEVIVGNDAIAQQLFISVKAR